MTENTNARNNHNGGSKEPFTFEIVEHICVLGRGKEEGFMKEFNFVSFRGLAPKWDIREWNKDHTRMTKGVTITDEEMKIMMEAMEGHKFPTKLSSFGHEDTEKQSTEAQNIPEGQESVQSEF